jgi:hypothetical protein
MTPRHPIRLAILAALALALAGCGGSSDDGTTEAATTTKAATTTRAAATTTAATTTATTTTAADVATIRITVVDAKPKDGILRPSVRKGTHVVLVVTSDTADEVHLHGYDLSADVEAGGTARIPFVADTPGRFVLELENLGVELAEITVQ